jgi:hypothetical protein
MQASTVLAGMYSERAQSQLQGAEEGKRRKTGKRKMGDGKAKYFSGDDFYRLCEEDKDKRLEETQEKERRGVERQAFAQKIATWQDANEAIRARNETSSPWMWLRGRLRKQLPKQRNGGPGG